MMAIIIDIHLPISIRKKRKIKIIKNLYGVPSMI